MLFDVERVLVPSETLERKDIFMTANPKVATHIRDHQLAKNDARPAGKGTRDWIAHDHFSADWLLVHSWPVVQGPCLSGPV